MYFQNLYLLAFRKSIVEASHKYILILNFFNATFHAWLVMKKQEFLLAFNWQSGLNPQRFVDN